MRSNIIGLVFGFMLASLLASCSSKEEQPKASSNAIFQTPWQTETEYIVQTILRDLAEELQFAATGRVPKPSAITISTVEQPGSSQDTPVFAVTITLDPTTPPIRRALEVKGMIWSPEVYQEIASELARVLKLKSRTGDGSTDASLLEKLLDGTSETIERENQRISEALAKDFGNPELHEEAAFLYAMFLMHDCSGKFLDIRAPLCRLTTHLTVARCLRQGKPGIHATLAEAALNTLTGVQSASLEQISKVSTNDPSVASFCRSLQALNTGDYRPLQQSETPTPFEQYALYCARSCYADLTEAWADLSDDQRGSLDYLRLTMDVGANVEIGHAVLRRAIPAELAEIQEVYTLAKGTELNLSELASALNVEPGGVFDTESSTQPTVRVIGWGQWANFLQRHLCNAAHFCYYFMNNQWGVSDEAKRFAREADKQFKGLRLYPLVQRLDAYDEAGYKQSMADGLNLTLQKPHLVPASCWNYLSAKPKFVADFSIPNPHINEWHKHNPPPGTVYDIFPRFRHPSLLHRKDAKAKFEELHRLAPYCTGVSDYLFDRFYTNATAPETAMKLYGPLMQYSPYAVSRMAYSVRDKPEEFERLIKQAAAIDPSYYYTLAEHAIENKNDDKAAAYYDKAADLDNDQVSIASCAMWRTAYWLRKGNTQKAREIAEHGADVYSYNGLKAAGYFHENTTNWAAAFDYYQKLEERYNAPKEVLNFCLRYKLIFDDGRYDEELEKRVRILFPKGLQPATLKDFQGAPTDGVVFTDDSETLRKAGLKPGDVVVAVHGIRVRSESQYIYARTCKKTPEMPIIVWQGDAYREFKPTLPDRRFGVHMRSYPEVKQNSNR